MKWIPTHGGPDDWPLFGMADTFMQMFAMGVLAILWYVRVQRATSMLVAGILSMLTGLFGGVAGLWLPTQALFVRLAPLLFCLLFVSLVWAGSEAIPTALRIRAKRIADRERQDGSGTDLGEVGLEEPSRR